MVNSQTNRRLFLEKYEMKITSKIESNFAASGKYYFATVIEIDWKSVI